MTVLEFDALDFLEYFDESFLDTISKDITKDNRDMIYNNLRNKVEYYTLSLCIENTTQITVDDMSFMIEIFNIIDEIDRETCIDLEKMLKKLQNFGRGHRNITKSLDSIETKLVKHDMRIQNLEMQGKNHRHLFTDFEYIFILFWLRFIVTRFCHNQVDSETSLGYGNSNLNFKSC